MARSSLTYVIATVRKLIADTGAAVFTDDDVQEALDRHRLNVDREELAPVYEAIDGSWVVRKYYSAYRYWEEDGILRDAQGSVLSPAITEWQVGAWTFAAHQPPPVYITGKSFDPYAAAADLLEAWAARIKLEYDFDEGGQSFARSQKIKQVLDLAAYYRMRQRAVVVHQERNDVER